MIVWHRMNNPVDVLLMVFLFVNTRKSYIMNMYRYMFRINMINADQPFVKSELTIVPCIFVCNITEKRLFCGFIQKLWIENSKFKKILYTTFFTIFVRIIHLYNRKCCIIRTTELYRIESLIIYSIIYNRRYLETSISR